MDDETFEFNVETMLRGEQNASDEEDTFSEQKSFVVNEIVASELDETLSEDDDIDLPYLISC